METVAAMIQLSTGVSAHDSAPPPTVEEVSAASAELNSPLLRRVKLSNDIARMRRLLRRLVRNANSHRLGGRSREEYLSTGRSTSPHRRRHPIAKRILRQSPRNVRSTGPARSELARACRIALMEATESVSVETIYDRIERRESFSCVGYKHPFRAIVLAMSAMVKRGEASLLSEAGHRRWRLSRGEHRLNDRPFSPSPDCLANALPRRRCAGKA
jgi:hypothetical protein